MTKTENTVGILYQYVFNQAETSLLENWIEKIIEKGTYDFNGGLLGAGWLVTYLIQHNYIEGDADEILEDIDDAIYKLTIQKVLAKETDISSLLHHITYYQQRMQYKSKAPYYRRFVHLECVKLLLDRLNNTLTETNAINRSEASLFVDIIFKYTYLVNTTINEELLQEAFYPATEDLISYYESQLNIATSIQELAKLYLSVKQYGNPYWEGRTKRLFDGMVNTENQADAWNRLAYYKEIPTYTDILKETEENGGNQEFLFQALTNIAPKKTILQQ